VPGPASGQEVKEVKYLVVLFEFEDLNHTKSYEEIRSISIDQMQTYYDEASYGKVKVRGDIITGWRKLPMKVKDLDLFRWISLEKDDMQKVDQAALFHLGHLKTEVELMQYAIKFVVYAGKVWGHARSREKTAFVNEFSTEAVYEHEVGHTLGLPDLYSYKAAREGKYSGANVGPWDLMSNGVGLCSWSKLQLGWIDQKQVADVRTYVRLEGTFIIDPIEDKNAKTNLLRVFFDQGNPSQAYYVEVRQRLSVDAKLDRRMRMGVLILFVDMKEDPREGGVKVIDSHPNSYSASTPSAELFDAPFSVGWNETAAFINRDRSFSIIVLGKMGSSYKVMVGNVATGEKAVEVNDVIGQAEKAIAKAEGEQRLKGLDEAKNALLKAKDAYAESRFTDAAATAKTSIELANSATKMPVVSTTATPTTSTTATAGTEKVSVPSPSFDILVLIIAIVIVALVAGLFLRKRKQTPTPAIPSPSTHTPEPPTPALAVAPTKYCVNCGASIQEDARHCPECGASQQ